MSEDDKIQILKDILFEDDSVYLERVSDRVQQLEETFEDRQKLSEKVNPIIAFQLQEFKRSIPATMGPAITAALKTEISKSQDRIVDALYPIMGKMIKKYIAQEISKLSDKISQQLGLRQTVRSWFGHSKEKQHIVDSLQPLKIEQVLLIEKKTGLLKGSYSNAVTIDEEMIAGMLTAIKNFVEDAFKLKGQNLELIAYELYRIHLQSFQRYYVAVALSGNYNLKRKSKVQDLIFDFYEDFTTQKEYESLSTDEINKKLTQNFGYADI
ncbi:MAG: cell envelope biogenesis protein OmpA [Pricia sp.]